VKEVNNLGRYITKNRVYTEGHLTLLE